jgi:hypothetical protein
MQPSGFAISSVRSWMQCHAAELEGGGTLNAQRFEEVLQAFEERIHPGQRVQVLDKRICHVVNQGF